MDRLTRVRRCTYTLTNSLKQRREEFVPGRGVVEINRQSVQKEDKCLSVLFQWLIPISLYSRLYAKISCSKVRCVVSITSIHIMQEITLCFGYYQCCSFDATSSHLCACVREPVHAWACASLSALMALCSRVLDRSELIRPLWPICLYLEG